MNNDPAMSPARGWARWIGGDGALHTLLRYATVGAASALVELMLFQGFYSFAGVPVMVANVMAICGVVVFGFLGQKRFTFRNRGPALAQARRYLLLVATSFALNNALVFLFAVALGWPATVAKVLQLGLSFLFNFAVSRYFVFGRVNSSD